MLTLCIPLSVLPVSVAQGCEVLHDVVLLPSHLLPYGKRGGHKVNVRLQLWVAGGLVQYGLARCLGCRGE